MAALAVLDTGALAGSAEFAAVVFSVFGHARAGFNLAIAIRMGTRFVSHGQFPPHGEEAVIMPLHLRRQRAASVPLLKESVRIQEYPCLLFSTKAAHKFFLG